MCVNTIIFSHVCMEIVWVRNKIYILIFGKKDSGKNFFLKTRLYDCCFDKNRSKEGIWISRSLRDIRNKLMIDLYIRMYILLDRLRYDVESFKIEHFPLMRIIINHYITHGIVISIKNSRNMYFQDGPAN